MRDFERKLEEQAAHLLGTRTEGFDPLDEFKKLSNEERLRLINAARQFMPMKDSPKED